MTKKVSMTNICRLSKKRFRDREVARTLIHHESHKPNSSPFYVLFPAANKCRAMCFLATHEFQALEENVLCWNLGKQSSNFKSFQKLIHKHPKRQLSKLARPCCLDP